MRNYFTIKLRNQFLQFGFLMAFFGFIKTTNGQNCPTSCASCTLAPTGCNYTVNSNDTNNFSFRSNSGGRMCILGGTYSGNVTIIGGNNNIVILVAPGAVFAPKSITYGVFINGSFTLEVQQGGTAILPPMALSYNGSVTIRNCGVIRCTAELGLPGSGTGNGSVTIQNSGLFTVAGTLRLGTNGGRNICNSDTMHFGSYVVTGNISGGITNNGYIEVDSSWNINGSVVTNTLCPNSLIRVKGNWTDNSRTSGTYCAKVEVGGVSTCNSCRMTGVWDFCDTTGVAPTKAYPAPKVDVVSGFNASWASTITYCTNCVPAAPVSVSLNGGKVCQGACHNLLATASGGLPPYTYTWTPAVGTGAGPHSVCPTTTTTYSVTVRDAAGSSATATATVSVNPAPVVSISSSKGIGCDSNAIYIGYGPQSLTLTANVISGVIASYQWYLNGSPISGATGATYDASAGGVYNVIATDTAGCKSDSSNTGKTIKVVDVRCGKNLNKVIICHVSDCRQPAAHSICIGVPAVDDHLRNHACDCLGPCPSNGPIANPVEIMEIRMSISPNPFTRETQIEFSTPETNQVTVGLYDLRGTLMKTLFNDEAEADMEYTVKVDGSNMQPGIYSVILRSNNEVIHQKLVLTK